MEIILKETVDNLGQEGDIVKVKPGYGRNYLLPKGKAVVSNEVNKAIVEKNKAAIEERLNQALEEAEALSKKLSGIVIEIAQLASEDERLFGSVTSADIVEKLAENKINVDKKQVMLSEPIKTLGETIVPIKVGFQKKTDITIQVTPILKEEK